MKQTYLTTSELGGRIKYNDRTIREQMIDSVLIEGRHYFRPFGGRKILFIWENIEADMFSGQPKVATPFGGQPMACESGWDESAKAIPMSRGKQCHV